MDKGNTSPLKVVVALAHEAEPYNALADALASADVPRDSYDLVRSMGPRHLEEIIGDADVLVGWHLEPELLRLAKKLRWVQFASAGVDDLLHPALVQSPVVVTSAAGTHGAPVAEHVFALVLAFTRGLIPAWLNQRERRWDRTRVRLAIRELSGMTLLVIGLGQIGREVARLGQAFGMRVLAITKDGASEDADEVHGPEGLPKCLPRADVIVVTVPLTQETRGMIGVDEVRLMKPSAYLVNVGRGPVVREDILAEALRRGWIAGAGLDVFDAEPLPPNHPFYNLDNCIITPHVAGVTPYYWARMARVFVENFKAFLAGQPMPTQVDKTRGY